VKGTLLAVAALLVAGCGPGRVVRRGEVNADLVAAIRERLSAVRGLAFRAEVPARALEPEEIRANLARELDQSFRPGELERLTAVYARLGLLPPGVALRPALTRLYEGQIAAFYDPRVKQLAVATRALGAGGFWLDLFTTITRIDLVGEMLVAHELTHALQDQHWGLPAEPDPLTESYTDRLVARRALLEGDATLSSFACLQASAPDAGTIDRIVEELGGVARGLEAQYPDVPAALRATLAFQYGDGTAFAARGLREGGWAALDRAHQDPPASSEQVLHSERYWAERDHPTAVALGGTEALAAGGWTRAYEDTLGELDVRVIARRLFPEPRALAIAAGWDGDRLRALARDEALVLVWMTVWDTPADAAEFTDAALILLPEARLERRGDRVLVLLGPDGGIDLAALGGAVWAATRIGGLAVRRAPGVSRIAGS
jgi:hypothetical protein